MELDEKIELRKSARRSRELARNSERQLFTWLHITRPHEIKNAHHIGTYFSYGDEPATTEINSALLAAGKKLFLPRVLADNSLEWVAWSGKTSDLKKSERRNVMEPAGLATPVSVLDVIIVPALLIDRSGYRLGQGGGSYDRALAESTAWTIALVYEGEITSTPLPHEEHDQKVNAVATPEILIRFKK